MATALASNLPRRTWIDGADRELKRIQLPSNRDNPLFVNGVGNASSDSAEAYKILRTNVLKAQLTRGISVIAVTSPAHGDGKTLTSFNLACCCAQLESTAVLLIDADLRTGGLTKLVNGSPQSGLAEMLNGDCSFEDAMVATELTNLHLIGAGSNRTSPAELFSTETWLQFVTWARAQFKLVIVDSLPVRAVADFDLIASACDGIMMVVRALKTPREGLEEALAQLDTNSLVGVVWNGAQKPPKYQSYPYAR